MFKKQYAGLLGDLYQQANLLALNPRSIYRDRSGVVGVLFALIVPVLLGFIALGTEVGLWYLERRNLQTAADTAAVAAAFEIMADTDDEQAMADRAALYHGVNTANGDTLQLDYPPVSGAAAGDSDAVQVTVGKTVPLLFAHLFLTDSLQISAHATAHFSAGDTACAVSLDGSAYRAIDVGGTATLNMPDCILASNSTSSEAISIRGRATVRALTLTTAGDYNVSGSGTLVTETAPQTGAVAFSDPYADVEIPPPGACNYTSYQLNTQTATTVSPGSYCQGMSFSSQAIANFLPGVYIVNGGSFTVNGGATLSCPTCTGTQGVTIILTGSGTNYATITINGGANVSLKAAADGQYAGLLFFQDRNAPPGSNHLNGGATMQLTGSLYFPNQSVDFSGNASISAGSCTQIISRTVSFSGTANLGNDCDNTGVRQVTTTGIVRLVE